MLRVRVSGIGACKDVASKKGIGVEVFGVSVLGFRPSRE